MTRYYFINPAVKPQTEMSSQIELAISKSMETAFVSTMRDTAKQLSEKFGFSYEEALKALEIDSSKSSTMVTLVKPSKKSKEIDDEPVTSRELKFPLPFSGRIVDDCCLAVLNNSGLFSQCLNAPSSKSNQTLCSKCFKQSQSSPDGRPPYGFISERIAQGDEYVDPKKGSRPVHFTKVMRKLKLTREMIETEVSRLDIFFDTEHFVEPDSKRGRPKKNEDVDAPVVKSKKASKNITVETHEDMSSLSGSEEEDSESKKAAKKAQKEAELAEKEQKKAEKEAARKLKEQADEQKKVEKEAERMKKMVADEAEKEQKKAEKEARDLEKEMQKKAQKEAEDAAKEALKQAKDAARKIKEVAEASKKEAKETRMMGGEDAYSKKAEKFIKKAAKEEPAKESKPEKKEKPVKESKPAKEQKPTKEEKKPAAKKAKEPEPEPEPEPVQELEEEEEDEEPTYELAIAPKGQTDLKIQGVTYIYQNGNVFDKKTNDFVGTYDWKTKVFEMAEDDDEIDQEEEEIPPIEEDEEEEEVVASQSDEEEEED
jgi:hypothetical protein